MLINLAVWTTISLLLMAVGYPANTWEFWCFIGTYWAMQQTGRMHGKMEGIWDFLSMNEAEQNKLKELFKEMKAGSK